jgi:hypothetical protein
MVSTVHLQDVDFGHLNKSGPVLEEALALLFGKGQRL